ncbi:MAG: hypothetical protein J1G06_08560 [Oscillospiraceae bacterium]|nr:hypothetical protein [Oscillospiraceae bacterium]
MCDVDYFADEEELRCDECDDRIYRDDNYYRVKFKIFCSHCTDAAAKAIFEVEQENYLCVAE